MFRCRLCFGKNCDWKRAHWIDESMLLFEMVVVVVVVVAVVNEGSVVDGELDVWVEGVTNEIIGEGSPSMRRP